MTQESKRIIVIWDRRRISTWQMEAVGKAMKEKWAIMALLIRATDLDGSPLVVYNIDQLEPGQFEQLRELVGKEVST